ncbi:TIGR02677 family protein [Peribacillus simplex]|uniref:TIGR02677 family protein n=1 Tax=Peribacillus simplex TaxID=1478 RepID=A0A9W4PGQ0_9BACI|nr:TIGR02677 family protein [Peribacillus simplex]WHX89020.1 TIGR02677 family protein [Peribacillus simplex]CAH0251866.1 hypothetical protein SRABI133_03148 [Peribacillus simplex]
MDIEQRLLQPFTKAKYLSEGNFRRYTSIIYYLYQQHEVYYAPPSLPTSILEHLHTHDTLGIFDEYTLSKLEEDLKSLEDWGNVISHADSSRVTRIEDFNKRKLRYQCTQETIDIERMLEKLNSQINRVKGSLDAGLVNSLSGLILKLESHQKTGDWSKEEREELSKLWQKIFDEFSGLRKESSDYLGVIHSKNIEDAMVNKEITAFRLKFTEYLTGFIITLQKNIHIIEYTIKEIDKNLIDAFIVELTENQKDKPTFDEALTDEEYHDIFTNQWNSMKKWFVYDEFDERYVDYLLKQTSETISRFTKYLQQISERDQQIKNRKKDFEHMARLFKNESDFQVCQKSFGAITNIEHPLHFFSQKSRTVNSDETLFEHEPEVKALKDAKEVPSRERCKMAAIQATAEDVIENERMRLKKETEEKAVQDLVGKEIVRLRELKGVEPFIRKAILQWISQVVGKSKMTGKTDQGIPYRIEKESEEEIGLLCTDGILNMPDYVLYFEVNY